MFFSSRKRPPLRLQERPRRYVGHEPSARSARRGAPRDRSCQGVHPARSVPRPPAEHRFPLQRKAVPLLLRDARRAASACSGANCKQDGLWGFSWVHHGKSPFVLPPLFAECRTRLGSMWGASRPALPLGAVTCVPPPTGPGAIASGHTKRSISFLAELLHHVRAYSACQNHTELGSSWAVRSAHLLLALTPDAAARAAGSSESSN